MKPRVLRHPVGVPLPDRELCEINLRYEGYRCRPWIDPRGRVWIGFRYEVDHVVQVVDGVARLVVGSEVIRLRSGDRAFIPAGCLYSLANIGPDNLSWIAAFATSNDG